MSALTVDDLQENDRVSQNETTLNNEIEPRNRMEVGTDEEIKKQEETPHVKADVEVNKISLEDRLAAAYKVSNIVDDSLDPDEKVTKETFYARYELLRQKSDLMDDEIKNAQKNCDTQILSFNSACKILFQLRRLETCCAKIEKWTEVNYTDEYKAAETEIDLAEEQLIAEHIRGLLDKRDEVLGRIEVVMNKIQTASGTLKRGFQFDRTLAPDGQLTEGAHCYELSICHEDDGNDYVEDIYDKNNFMTKRTKDALRRYRRMRNEQYCKNKTLKTAIKNDAVVLELEKSRQDHRMFNDNSFNVGFNGCMNSAVFKSTLDTLTHQLELEQQMLSQPNSKQYAISDRVTNDNCSNKGTRHAEEASPNPTNPHYPKV